MSRRLVVIVGTFLVVALAVGLVWWIGRDGGDETVQVGRGSIDVTIDTVGTLQLIDNQTIRAGAGGTVIALGARAGDVVETGDILVLLDPEELDRQVEDAERGVEAAEFSLQFTELRAGEDPDSLSLRQSVLDARDRLDAANRALDEAVRRKSAGAIVAGRPGTVLDMLVNVDDRVNERQTVAVLFEFSDLRLIADVDELDLPNIALGVEARFRLDAYPAFEIEGSVVSTSPQAVQRGGATVFPTEVVFDIPPDIDIRPGMNADVTIITDLREDVLVVPERAIRTVGQRAFVVLREDGQEREVEVVLGYRGGGVAEVVSGIAEGDTIVLR